VSSSQQGPRRNFGDNRGGPTGPSRHAGHGGRDRPPERSITDLWPGYLDGGYFDPRGYLKIDYVSRDKVEPFVKAICHSSPRLTTHQVRRYFGHCRFLETRLRGGSVPWEDVLPEVKKLAIAAADGLHKQPKKIPDLFHDFIQRNVDKIKNQKDFLQGFLPHFEALIGFGQAHFDKGRN
jgi:CRISPR type III-A-associated protein Csm2